MVPNLSICVYCGSSVGRNQAYVEAASALGRSIGSAGCRLVYGGGSRGLMGSVARSTAAAGGQVLGIIPRFLVSREADDAQLSGLDELVVTENMHQRKHRMFEESDAFVALPGGIGTLEEIVEIMTWAQLGRHQKPVLFANVEGFWNPMLALLDHMNAQGFLHSMQLVRPLVIDAAEDIVPTILSAAGAARVKPGGDSAVIERM